MHPTSIKPHPLIANYTRIELESDITFATYDAAKLADANGKFNHRPRSIYVTDAGLGTLIVLDSSGAQRVLHNLESGKFVEPSPAEYVGTVAETTATDVSAFILVDDDTQTTTFTGWADDTTDANDAGTADVLFMPATEATADGFLVGMPTPFNGLEITLSTAGTVGVITWKAYTGDRYSYDATWTAVDAAEGAAKNLRASGDVTWQVPSNWKPCNINSYGDLYWIYGNVSTVFTINPAGSQVQAKNITTVGGIRVGS